MATKRIERVKNCLPNDWGTGYDNVTIMCSVENQKQADNRLPAFKQLQFKQKSIICEPLIGPVDLSQFLDGNWIDKVIVGGESGERSRACNYDWVIEIRNACIQNNVSFILNRLEPYF